MEQSGHSRRTAALPVAAQAVVADPHGSRVANLRAAADLRLGVGDRAVHLYAVLADGGMGWKEPRQSFWWR